MKHLEEQLNNTRRHVYESMEVSSDTIQRVHDRVLQSLPKVKPSQARKWPARLMMTFAAVLVVAIITPEIVRVMKPEPIASSHQAGSMPTNHKTADQQNNSVSATHIQPASEQDQLLRLDKLGFGQTYTEIRTEYPEIGPLGPEGGMDSLGQQGLTEAKVDRMMFEHPVSLEFNFKNDHMYSYVFTFAGLDQQTADSLAMKIRTFYEAIYGKSKTVNNDDPSSTTSQTILIPKKPEPITITRIHQADGTYMLSWGSQVSNP